MHSALWLLHSLRIPSGVVKPMKTVPGSLAGGERILLTAAFWSPRGYEAPARKLAAFSSHHRFLELGRADFASRQLAAVQTEPDGLKQNRQFIRFGEEVDVLREE